MKRSVMGKITFYVSNIQIRRKNNFSSNHIIDNFVPLCLNPLQYFVQDFKRTSETKISYSHVSSFNHGVRCRNKSLQGPIGKLFYKQEPNMLHILVKYFNRQILTTSSPK